MTTHAAHGESPFADVRRLLEPRSIAVIGASDSPGSLGGTVVRFLQHFGFPGPIWPVNPRRESVAGLPCYPAPEALPGPADLALLAVPATAVLEVVRACAAAGIGHGIVWAGGFAEIGGEGRARQDALVELCRETGFRLCGPNCIGIINLHLPMVASFASVLLATDRLLPGNISMVSQSGGMTTVVQALAQEAGFGFRHVISSGNEAVLTTADFIHALVLDPETKVIAAYLEGVRDPDKLLLALAAAREARKPVVMLKGGGTPASARAALAHTGALAGEERVWDAILHEHAVMRVHSQEELLDVALALSGTDLAKLPRGNRVGTITYGGGSGVLSADQCARVGLHTPPLKPDSMARLRPLVPPIASIGNPIDLTPEVYNQPMWLERLPQTLDVIAADPGLDALLFQGGPMGRHLDAMIEAIKNLHARAGKTVCVSWPFAPSEVRKRLPEAGIPVFTEHARAIRAIAHLARWRSALEQPRGERPQVPAFDWAAYVADPTPGTVVGEHACHRILVAAGLPVAPGRLVVRIDEALAAANAVGLPVALKGIVTSVTHRAAARLLALDLRSEEDVRDAYRRLAGRAQQLRVALEGVYVQRMARGGLELLVSAFADPQFGTMVSCGAGGTLTEVLDDVVLARAPVGVAEARRMLERLRIARHAARLAPEARPDAAAAFIAAFSQLAASAPWRRFVLEVNPIRWGRDGVVAVDGLLVVEEPSRRDPPS
jgi:acetate---CoA ligase (ADP-forming)